MNGSKTILTSKSFQGALALFAIAVSMALGMEWDRETILMILGAAFGWSVYGTDTRKMTIKPIWKPKFDGTTQPPPPAGNP